MARQPERLLYSQFRTRMFFCGDHDPRYNGRLSTTSILLTTSYNYNIAWPTAVSGTDRVTMTTESIVKTVPQHCLVRISLNHWRAQRGGGGGLIPHWKFTLFFDCLFACCSLNPKLSHAGKRYKLYTNFTLCFSFRGNLTICPRDPVALPPFGNFLHPPPVNPLRCKKKSWVCYTPMLWIYVWHATVYLVECLLLHAV